jgi:hypothetical protein
VEVLAAIAILLIGVLGVAALATGANKTTGRTKSHEAAAGLAREMLESARAMPYADLTAASLSSMLRQRHPDADAATPGWQVKRRGITYTATSSLCTLDDPKDGMGAHDASFCSDTGGGGTDDTNPNDYKRAMVTLAWNGTYGPQTTAQSTLITNSDRGPAVTTLDTSPPGNATVGSGNDVNFTLTTSLPPSDVEWYVDGAFQENLGKGISGSDTSYSFSWKIGSACTNNSATDGSYVVSAQAFNSAESTPGPRALTVRLNRCAPYAPTGVVGGRNRWGVELSWEANKEDDVVGYRVFRGIGSAPQTAIASGPCSGVVKTNGCIEPDPAPTQTLTYSVRAVDLDTSGSQRNGASSANLSVTTGNRAPATPVASNNGSSSTLRWSAVSDPDGGDSVDYYRIYRDGQTLAHRYDVMDAVTNPLLWTDADTGGTTHTYYVVAVDTKGAESGFSNGVTR